MASPGRSSLAVLTGAMVQKFPKWVEEPQEHASAGRTQEGTPKPGLEELQKLTPPTLTISHSSRPVPAAPAKWGAPCEPRWCRCVSGAQHRRARSRLALHQ